jgi:hypothetical protein
MLLYVFAIGYCAQAAPGTPVERLLLTSVALLALWRLPPLHSPDGYGIFLPGLVILIWTTSLPVPARLRHSLQLVAASSFMIYLSHPFPERALQVFYGGALPLPLALLALPFELAIGVGIWLLLQRLEHRSRSAGGMGSVEARPADSR